MKKKERRRKLNWETHLNKHVQGMKELEQRHEMLKEREKGWIFPIIPLFPLFSAGKPTRNLQKNQSFTEDY